jgi:hypothetical protein
MDDHRQGIQVDKPKPMGDHHEGVQADKPISPWERPGSFRMDCEPHRAGLLRLVGTASIIVGFLSIALPFVLLMFGLAFSIHLPFPLLVIGLALSVMTRHMARSDLAKMHKGLMDPGGEWQAIEALSAGLCGLVLNLLSVVGWGALFLGAFLMMP